MKHTFNTAVVNVLWQIVTSKRFDPDHPETKQMIEMLEAQLKSMTHRKMLGNLLQYLPLKKSDKSVIEHKSMMKKFISEHLEDIDYDHPRDFIDVYLTEMRNNSNFDEDHLIVMCLDFFQAGAETTSTSLLWVNKMKKLPKEIILKFLLYSFFL